MNEEGKHENRVLGGYKATLKSKSREFSLGDSIFYG